MENDPSAPLLGGPIGSLPKSFKNHIATSIWNNEEWFLRQLGHVQSIPNPPYRPLKAVRGRFAQKYSVKYGFQLEN
ncbi:hypothetical protein Scep_012658 [Stephania cephalantha]|uniref:Uncharacterized protein n=1 Tax=Stephania cephalantha TaxID=152367 RepID=A0AAP0JGC8_9MAGN